MPHKDPEVERAYNRAWAKARRLRMTEEERAQRRTYRRTHPDKMSADRRIKQRAYHRAWAKAHLPALVAQNRARRRANPCPRSEVAKATARAHAKASAARKRAQEAHNPALKAANDAKRKAYRIAYYLKHKTQIIAKSHAYYTQNKEAINTRMRQRVQEDPAFAEHRRQFSRARNAREPEKNRTRAKAYAQAHPEKVKTQREQRRAWKSGASQNDLTHAQWLEIQGAQDHCCYYCGKRCKGKLTQDHITPLSKGGSHTLHNVIGACQTCNSKKHAGAPPIPVQPLLLTLAPSKKKKAS